MLGIREVCLLVFTVVVVAHLLWKSVHPPRCLWYLPVSLYFLCFSLSDSILPSTVLPLSFSIHPCGHVVGLGLKLWAINPIMNHHALFRLPFPTGIDCVMKLSFSHSKTLSSHNSLKQYGCTHKTDNEKIYVAWNKTLIYSLEVVEESSSIKHFVNVYNGITAVQLAVASRSCMKNQMWLTVSQVFYSSLV